MEVDETISVVASIASRSAAESVSSGSASKKQALQQPSVDASFRRRSAAPALNALAVAFAANSIAYAVVENSAFRALLTTLGWPGDLPSRELVRNAVQHNSAAVRQDVIDLLKDAVVTLAADGWTNVKRQKVTNIVLMLQGKALYWCSIVNTGENTAEWLAGQLLRIITTLINEHKARVIGVVVDNEAVNGAAHRLLLPDLPFLIHIPCAAHTIQLIVRSCLELPQMKPLVEQLCTLIRFFDVKENRIALRRIQEAREMGEADSRRRRHCCCAAQLCDAARTSRPPCSAEVYHQQR